MVGGSIKKDKKALGLLKSESHVHELEAEGRQKGRRGTSEDVGGRGVLRFTCLRYPATQVVGIGDSG